jgi:hypothetical protein
LNHAPSFSLNKLNKLNADILEGGVLLLAISSVGLLDAQRYAGQGRAASNPSQRINGCV